MTIKIFADGASLDHMVEWYRDPQIAGFTTNPTLMRKAGVTDYAAFAQAVLAKIPDRPISFEVFSDELPEMERQARIIAGWGRNVYVKIPVTNTRGTPTLPIIASLSESGVQLNVTAVFTPEQVQGVVEALAPTTPSVVSVFAGRIANTGTDPMPIMREAVRIAAQRPTCEVLWASPREALNLVQAEACGCHIITMTPDLLKTVKEFGKTLRQFSLETVQMFYRDATEAGYSL